MIPPNLIINADDFGLHPRISLGIARCLDEGLINSFSVMPFSDAFHGELLRLLLARHPGIRVGAHLSLLEEDSPGLRDHHPRLRDHPLHFRDFLALYARGKLPPSRIQARWRDQIQALGAYVGGPGNLAHLDSHQHLHVLPGLWPVAAALRKEFGIPRLRAPYESFSRSLGYRFPFGAALQGLAWLRRERRSRRFLGFFSSTRFTLEANLPGVREVLRHPEREYELMVHPVLPPDPALFPGPDETTFSPRQADEIGELRRLREFLLASQSA